MAYTPIRYLLVQSLCGIHKIKYGECQHLLGKVFFKYYIICQFFAYFNLSKNRNILINHIKATFIALTVPLISPVLSSVLKGIMRCHVVERA